MNSDRAANGVGPLAWNGQLGGMAQNWANWMAQNHSLSHQDLNALIGSTGFSILSQNVLFGPGSLSAGGIEQIWMNSAPHRANILNGALRAAGVGVAVSGDGQLWVCVDFGG